MVATVRAARAGDWTTARELHERYLELLRDQLHQPQPGAGQGRARARWASSRTSCAARCCRSRMSSRPRRLATPSLADRRRRRLPATDVAGGRVTGRARGRMTRRAETSRRRPSSCAGRRRLAGSAWRGRARGEPERCVDRVARSSPTSSRRSRPARSEPREPDPTAAGGWRVEPWVKAGILLGFRLPGHDATTATGPSSRRATAVAYGVLDMLDGPGARAAAEAGAPWRVVPGGTTRPDGRPPRARRHDHAAGVRQRRRLGRARARWSIRTCSSGRAPRSAAASTSAPRSRSAASSSRPARGRSSSRTTRSSAAAAGCTKGSSSGAGRCSGPASSSPGRDGSSTSSRSASSRARPRRPSSCRRARRRARARVPRAARTRATEGVSIVGGGHRQAPRRRHVGAGRAGGGAPVTVVDQSVDDPRIEVGPTGRRPGPRGARRGPRQPALRLRPRRRPGRAWRCLRRALPDTRRGRVRGEGEPVPGRPRGHRRGRVPARTSHRPESSRAVLRAGFDTAARRVHRSRQDRRRDRGRPAGRDRGPHARIARRARHAPRDGAGRGARPGPAPATLDGECPRAATPSSARPAPTSSA